MSESDIYNILAETGLVQSDWYLRTHPDVAAAKEDPAGHYCRRGYKEGRRPNPYFDPTFYAAQLGETLPSEVNPLFHYHTIGERLGIRPSLWFDPLWYAEKYKLTSERSFLGHYLRNAATGLFSPIPEFDTTFYLAHNPDIKRAQVDPFLHYMQAGYRENRQPSAGFDIKFYRRRYLKDRKDENPLLHYIQHKSEIGVFPRWPEHEPVWSRLVRDFTRPGPSFEEFKPLPAGYEPRAKLLAYYLPQFHAIAENDRWWGRGFTEWVSVARAEPRFIGHYQPRIPRDLGFYNLANIDVLARQAEMARQAGIYGFVFYFYWFNQRRLLEKPLAAFFERKDIEMPFALMWANENWTRRWDGFDSEILIQQDYAPEHDTALINVFLSAFRDPRYIQVGGRPLLMVYRPGLIPESKKTFQRWRDLFEQLGNVNPLIIMAQGFGDTDPTPFGLDGAIEFPPHKLAQNLPKSNEDFVLVDPDFEGEIKPYDALVQRSLDENPPSFPLIKTVVPSWDNEPRRPGSGTCYHGTSPEKYETWLEQIVARSRTQKFYGESFVAINAWNEWGESAYLEPDVHYGAAYLNATGRAVAGMKRSSAGKVALVIHDAHPHGAQILTYYLARVYARQFGMDVHLIVLQDGPLRTKYAEIVPCTVATTPAELTPILKRLFAQGWRYAIVNSAASAWVVEHAAAIGFATSLLVHELPGIIREKMLLPSLDEAVRKTESIVFASSFVRDRVRSLIPAVKDEDVRILPQGCYTPVSVSEEARRSVRAELNISGEDLVVLGVGYADLRKGFDLFIQCSRMVLRKTRDIHFLWVGDLEFVIDKYLRAEISVLEKTGKFHLVGFKDSIESFYSASDIFLLSSREDPFPSVVLEGLSAGLPCIAFEDSGGIPQLIQELDAGQVVPLADLDAAADGITKLRTLLRSKERLSYRERLRRIIEEKFYFESYAADLLSYRQFRTIKISAVVTSYNYAKYLRARLMSIFRQTYPIFEIIVLDDCSTDNSVGVAEAAANEAKRDISIVRNEVNSGSVFAQWRQATRIARGDYLWIAESDDEADSCLVEKLTRIISENPNIVIAFADSRAIDEHGTEVSPSYKTYYREFIPGALESDGVYEGREFVTKYLSERNVILNVSSALLRTKLLAAAIDRAGETLGQFSVAGDWYLYVDMLRHSDGQVAYIAEPLNVHRRHTSSVTSALRARKHIDEIATVHAIVRELDNSPSLFERQDKYLQFVENYLGTRERAPDDESSASGRGSILEGESPDLLAQQVMVGGAGPQSAGQEIPLSKEAGEKTREPLEVLPTVQSRVDAETFSADTGSGLLKDPGTIAAAVRLQEEERTRMPEASSSVSESQPGSAVPSKLSSSGKEAVGWVETLRSDRVSGWVWNPAEPSKRQQVMVEVDGVVVGSGVADRFRQDLLAAGKGDGRYGFRIELLGKGPENVARLKCSVVGYASPLPVVESARRKG
jgi:glycosyltransferase involved in cell wall biosynthesis